MQRGEVESLGGDALTGEGCVAVDDDGKNFLLTFFAYAFLPCASAPEDDGVHGLEV